jgi:ABC-type multidrug transport system ATPase subunit
MRKPQGLTKPQIAAYFRAANAAARALGEPLDAYRKRVMKEVCNVTSIKQLNRTSGVTVVLITHHMDEAAQADRLVVMAKGKVIADGEPKKVFQDVEGLKAVGLTVPHTTELLWQLRQEGLDLPLDALSDEECAQALYELLSK